MSNFNYLSGSSVDNNTEMLFELFDSGKCYLGFSRGEPALQWGLSALVNITSPAITGLLAPTISAGDDKYFSLHTTGMNDANRELRKVYIASVTSGVWTIIPGQSNTIGDLYLSFINQDWALISGFKKDYYTAMPVVAGTDYYLLPSNTLTVSGAGIPILKKEFKNLPYYTVNCSLNYIPSSGGSEILASANLQKTVNVLGETYVLGMTDTGANIFNDSFLTANANKAIIKDSKFVLRDSSGQMLIENMSYVDQSGGDLSTIYTEGQFIGASSKYIVLRYKFTDVAVSAAKQTDYQYLKFMIAPNGVGELAIWNEALPFDSMIPVADAYPPSLDVSYLKNPYLATSIFDIRGMVNIAPSADIWYMKQLMSPSEAAAVTSIPGMPLTVEDIILNGPMTEHIGYVSSIVSGGTIIPMNNFHTFVVGDQLFIPTNPTSGDSTIGTTYTVSGADYTIGAASITLNTLLSVGVGEYLPVNYPLISTASDVVAKITIAKTQNKKDGLKYGCTNILINKSVPNVGITSPTSGIYRQLFVCYNPSDNAGAAIAPSPLVQGDFEAIYNPGTGAEEIGMLLYISNTIAFYRKYALGGEEQEFKIII